MAGPALRGQYGLISLFVRHRNAANLTMVLMLIFGVYAIGKLNTQLFPTAHIDTITISIVWPGASAEDVSDTILDAIEPEVRFIEGVDKTTSYAREGAATIRLDFKAGSDMQKAQSDVESAVSRITTLPEEAESPEISRALFFDTVGKIALSGPFPESALKVFAKRMRDDLIARGIDRVTFTGLRDEEIHVEIAERELRRLDLTVGDIAQQIGANTRDRPSGVLDGRVERQLRAETDAETPAGISRIEVKSLTGGERVLVRDIAGISPAFDEDQERGFSNGERAIELVVWRTPTTDTLEADSTVDAYLDEARLTFPQSLTIAKYEVGADRVLQRINLLVKNGLTGLILVVVVMYLFLDARIAFWVAAGIPVAMFATLGVMYASGQSINMISLFSLIMTLGIIVDDAIVVGEHTATRHEAGDDPVEAAERGAGRMLAPVIAASLTTMAAFAPIFLVRDVMGQMMAALPMVVIAVLIASLVECFLVLPGHLAHSLRGGKGVRWAYWRQLLIAALLTGILFAILNLMTLEIGTLQRAIDEQWGRIDALNGGGAVAVILSISGYMDIAILQVLKACGLLREALSGIPERALPLAIAAFSLAVATLVEAWLYHRARREAQADGAAVWSFRRTFDRWFAWFRDGPFHFLVRQAFAWRYVVVAICISIVMICTGGLIGGGRVGFIFFPSPEAEYIKTNVEFNAGLPEHEAIAALDRIDAALRKVETDFGTEPGALIGTSFVTFGKQGRNEGDNLAEIDVELTASEVRTVRTPEIVNAWRQNLPAIAGVKRVAITERRGGPPGRDLDLRIHDAPPDVLKTAALEIADFLTGFPGVKAVADDLPFGKPETVMTLTPRGAALGFDIEDVGSQVRDAFQGAIARRLAQGDEEVVIRVLKRMPASGSAQLRRFELKSPNGDFVPLVEVVDLSERQGFSVIQRRDGRTTVSITADIDNDIATNQEIVSALRDSDRLAEIMADHGIGVSFAGREEERQKSFADLRLGVVIALTVIYIILAWVFSSYLQPFLVMLIIPFGVVGAILGHYLLDYRLTLLSYVAILGLSGILVNDSIILVSRINERLSEGMDLAKAAIGASCDRLRAVLLTSLTTIGGLTPLLFERSLQAQFLMPMAITIVFGLGFATMVVLFLIPALTGIGSDIARLFRLVYGVRRPIAGAAE